MTDKSISQTRMQELFEYRNGELYRKVAIKNTKIGDKAGSAHTEGYLQIGIDGKTYKLHRVIFLMHYGYLPDEVDHKDTDPSNNKIENLRPASRANNAKNRAIGKNNTSGYKGVSWSKAANKWKVEVSVNGKRKYIGVFKDLEQANLIAQKVRIKYHGAFANHG